MRTAYCLGLLLSRVARSFICIVLWLLLRAAHDRALRSVCGSHEAGVDCLLLGAAFVYTALFALFCGCCCARLTTMGLM